MNDTNRIRFQKGFPGQDIQGYRRKCWSSHYLSCSACTSQNHIGQCGRCSRVECFQVLNPYVTCQSKRRQLEGNYIPIDDIQLMQVFKSEKEFGAVKARDSRVNVRTSQRQREEISYRARSSLNRCSRCRWWNNSPPLTKLDGTV